MFTRVGSGGPCSAAQMLSPPCSRPDDAVLRRAGPGAWGSRCPVPPPAGHPPCPGSLSEPPRIPSCFSACLFVFAREAISANGHRPPELFAFRTTPPSVSLGFNFGFFPRRGSEFFPSNCLSWPWLQTPGNMRSGVSLMRRECPGIPRFALRGPAGHPRGICWGPSPWSAWSRVTCPGEPCSRLQTEVSAPRCVLKTSVNKECENLVGNCCSDCTLKR